MGKVFKVKLLLLFIFLACGFIDASKAKNIKLGTKCVVEKATGTLFYSGKKPTPAPELAGLDDCIGREENYEEASTEKSSAGIFQPVFIPLLTILYAM